MKRIFTIIMISAAVLFTANSSVSAYENPEAGNVDRYEHGEESEDEEADEAGNNQWRQGYLFRATWQSLERSFGTTICAALKEKFGVDMNFLLTQHRFMCCMHYDYQQNACNFAEEEAYCKYVDRNKED